MNRLLKTLLIAVLLIILALSGCTNNNPGASASGSVTGGLPTTSSLPRVSPSMTVSPPQASPSTAHTVPATITPLSTTSSSAVTSTSPKVSISVVPS